MIRDLLYTERKTLRYSQTEYAVRSKQMIRKQIGNIISKGHVRDIKIYHKNVGDMNWIIPFQVMVLVLSCSIK